MPRTRPGIEIRRALYYPYIHPRKAAWVKATLLAFGQLYRIVPDGYPLDDVPEVAALRDLGGPDGKPLIARVSPEWNEIEEAQFVLFQTLSKIPPEELKARFGRLPTIKTFRSADKFQIHEEKINLSLLHLLERQSLVWRPEHPERGSARPDRTALARLRGTWWSIHPALGQAIMSLTAIAAANREGLDIVTDQAALHSALSTLDARQVLEELVQGASLSGHAVTEAQQVDELTHVVMLLHVNASKLKGDDIANLVRDGEDLSQFRQGLADAVNDIPKDLSPAVRRRRLEARAKEIIVDWDKHRRRWSSRLRSALLPVTRSEGKKWFDKATDDLVAKIGEKAATGGLGGLATGTITGVAIGAGLGMTVGFVQQTVRKMSSTGPYRYLSRLEKAGAKVVVTPVAPAPSDRR